MAFRHVTHRVVYHVGKLPTDVPLRLPPAQWSDSYEGIGLSVSLHPDAWIIIAKLGGGTTYALCRRDGSSGRFVVYTKRLEATALRWAIAVGLAVPISVFEVRYMDEDEDGVQGERWMEFTNRGEAEEEAAARREEEIGMGLVPFAHVKRRSSVGPGPRLVRAWRRRFGSTIGVRETWATRTECLNRFVSAEDRAADGVWWNEILDVTNLSAPRGNILAHALPRWSAEALAGFT